MNNGSIGLGSLRVAHQLLLCLLIFINSMPHTSSAKRAQVAQLEARIERCCDIVTQIQSSFDRLANAMDTFEEKAEFIAAKVVLRDANTFCPLSVGCRRVADRSDG